MDRPFGKAKRYAVRVTGPAGHSRYVTMLGGEDDRESEAFVYTTVQMAEKSAAQYRAAQSRQNIVCDVVNLDDPEDRCSD